MAGLDGLIQRLTDECEEKEQQAHELLSEVHALRIGIDAMKATMREPAMPEAPKVPTMRQNDFLEGSLPWYAYRVLEQAWEIPLTWSQVHERLKGQKPCTKSAVYNALRDHPEAFEQIRDGVFQLRSA